MTMRSCTLVYIEMKYNNKKVLESCGVRASELWKLNEEVATEE